MQNERDEFDDFGFDDEEIGGFYKTTRESKTPRYQENKKNKENKQAARRATFERKRGYNE